MKCSMCKQAIDNATPCPSDCLDVHFCDDCEIKAERFFKYTKFQLV